jgi:TonB family protein
MREVCAPDSVRAVAQLGRAPGSGPGGRGFKSHQPDKIWQSPDQIGAPFDSLLMFWPSKNTHLTLSGVITVLVLLNSVRAGEVEVFTGRPPGVVKFVSPGYPAKLRPYGWNGKGRFLLKVNSKTGDVDEVKVVTSTGHVLLNELCAKAFFQWKFQPGSAAQVVVPVDFYARGFSRDLH